MDRKRAKDLFPLLKAYSEGKDIQHFNGTEWADVQYPSFSDNIEHYRIKPEPKYGPYINATQFIADFINHGPFVCFKKDNSAYFSVRVIHPISEGITINVSHSAGVVELNYNELFNKYTWQDGAKCGMIYDQRNLSGNPQS